MRLTSVLLLAATFQVSARGNAQNISLSGKNLSLQQVFSAIEGQTHYSFVYKYNDIQSERPVELHLRNATIRQALDACFQGRELTYTIENNLIAIKKEIPASAALPPPPPAPVTGTVVSQQGGPLAGVSVTIAGTNRGTVTDAGGAFSITAETGDVIEFSFVGYETKRVTVGDSRTLHVALVPAQTALTDIVVTALGVRRSEKSLTYATQQIGTDELNRVKTDNLMNSLSGKVAGVTIAPSASGVGGSTKVLLRGSRSASGNNQPLYVIDGIPISNGANANAQPSNTYGGTPDGGDGISNLNPEDIASITVLEGASAAALYGSQAQNGVILITTKKGRTGQAVVNFSSSLEASTPAYKPDFQNTYGQTSANAPDSWGAKLTAGTHDNLKDYFQTGTNWTNAINLSTGSDKAQTYFSYANTSARGLEPGNKLERNNFTLRETGKLLNDKLTVDGNINYVTQTIDNSPALGLYSNPLVGLYLFPRGLDIAPYKNNYLNADSTGFARQNWPFLKDGTTNQENPFWIQHMQPSVATRNRILFNGSVRYDVASWLNIQARGDVDHIADNYENDLYSGTIGVFNSNGNGHLNLSNQTTEHKYGDLIANFNFPAWGALKLDGLAGYSITDDRTSGFYTSSDLSTPDFFTLGNTIAAYAGSTSNTTSNVTSTIPNTTTPPFPTHSQLQALFASADLSYKNWVYLTLTGRNDWSSNLAYTPNFSYFYPSAGLSLILTQMFHLPEAISYAKVRGAWAQVGNTVPPYLTNVQNTQNAAGQLVFNTADAFRTLKPEKTNSTELGTEWRFFHDRLNFTFTYYKTNTHNQYFPIQPVIASLYSTGYVNAGNIQNSGIEFTLGLNDAVKTKNFSWSTSINGAANKNKIIDVDSRDSINSFVLTSNYNNAYESHLTKGGQYGDIYGYTLKRNAQGQVLLNGTAASGYTPQINNGAFSYIGNPNPKFQLGWSNTLTYGKFVLTFLVDGKFGGQVLSMTQAVLDQYGVSKASGDARNSGGVKINGVDASGNAVSTIDAKNWYTTIGGTKGVTGEYMYSATVVRLREAALGYNLPVTGHFFKSARLSVIGRNLVYFYKKAPFDPELTMSTGNGLSGIDLFNQPATRNVGINLNLTF
ncbi:MAG TPA: SusC/RagA family TonB-linked outer membrane protein [Dinghuibacter sp.]|uniref:SusC/RagA family TonB-linked outer membrane protein n=1 Tax=Dinghuibacter sp. TaxID=2024697 RepID=UPI002CF66E7C|nr:SusC/RagA family TonB-linked outer membrane protein [Dinghuibacter sp.]HTJ12109.1 SusC/RagA family TonB-linked outer membrane protein [Dinghuibacter sp.]